ncbi:hypothetical protein Agabi119p4_10246 [Agaricus bisporus var. burnettii]|uniref:F-box domain-containing protein n=1 Tax=Agaricus bisporus var. burnettii TaxID=192524 RepID=A0A8H7C208_AGABI|nr:hypothetical protein Agabi119p4_10246 [Agaricus bisporus var. burnettii]
MLPKSNHGYSLRPTTRLDAKLPTEIVLEIIEYVKEDHNLSSLYSYSLVSLDWLVAMRGTLFTEMRVNFDQLSKLICLLRSPCCSLTPHIRNLRVYHSPSWKEIDNHSDSIFCHKNFRHYAGRISKIVQLLPNVTQLYLQFFDFPSIRRKFRHKTYAAFDQIETLVLGFGICEALPFAIEEVLCSFPRIRKLECEGLCLIDADTSGFSKGLALQHPSAEYFPELTELSIANPTVDLVTVFNNCLSLRNVQRLTYEWASWGSPRDELEAVLTMLQLIGPSLAYLSFTQVSERIQEGNSRGWDFKHNTNLHTFVLQIYGASELDDIGEKLGTMTISNLRNLVFNINLFPIDVRTVLQHCHHLTQTFENSDDVYGGLEKLLCNVRAKAESETREEITQSLRNVLDPGGRRRWWERGILQIVISYY